ncbi:MAG: HEPN domain-containing protein, partial [Myxococcota bacterium]
MHSKAHEAWFGSRKAELNRLELAHAALGGSGPGRRHTTQQVNQAYTVLLSSYFQAYCRDVHSTASAFLAKSARPTSLSPIMQVELTRGRKLDRGNPNPDNLESDFKRLGLALWATLDAEDTKSSRRKAKLDELMSWRNAIAHQDFTKAKLKGRSTIRLREVRGWRSACNGLVRTMDLVVGSHVRGLVGRSPW